MLASTKHHEISADTKFPVVVFIRLGAVQRGGAVIIVPFVLSVVTASAGSDGE
jgi:hypothetical protein